MWRTTFDEAAEAPPSRVWDAIERQLDESNSTKIVPLWGTGLVSSQPLLWGTGMAAAVALLLVGWWVMHTPTGVDQYRISDQRQTAMKPVAPKATVPGNSPAYELQKHPTRPIELAINPTTSVAKKSSRPSYDLSIPPLESQPDGSLSQLAMAPAYKMPVSGESLDLLPVGAEPPTKTVSNQINTPGGSPKTAASFVREDQSSLSVEDSEQLKTLRGKPIRLHEFGHIYRIVWFRPSEVTVQPDIQTFKQKSRDLWASASIMPGAFNPMVSVQMASLANAGVVKNTSITNGAYQAQSVTSRANFSITYQFSAGMLLNKRWSIETGVGFLAGRSTVDTPTQLSANAIVATNDIRATTGNLYVDALRNSSANGRKGTSLDQANFANNGYVQPAYSDKTRQMLTNDYQFVQVPVQVGYQLRPKKRLSLAVLGGIISNIFVRNTVDNEIIVTTKDDIYRPVSFAAIVGARFRYQPSAQWSASLAGIYQPSIGLVTLAHSQVQSQPTTAGMTLGVDYHF